MPRDTTLRTGANGYKPPSIRQSEAECTAPAPPCWTVERPALEAVAEPARKIARLCNDRTIGGDECEGQIRALVPKLQFRTQTRRIAAGGKQALGNFRTDFRPVASLVILEDVKKHGGERGKN